MKGQTVIEYIIVVGLVVMALYAMGPAFKRGVQSVIRGTADQLAPQKEAEQDFSKTGSHMDYSRTNSEMNSERTVKQGNYSMSISATETSDTTTRSMTNMGFIKQ